MLRGMSPETRTRLHAALAIYAESPLEDGDGVLFLDGAVILELPSLAGEWDAVVRGSLGHTLRETASEVVLAIARRGADLLPADFRLWRELHEELRDSPVDLVPLQALPAA